MPLDLLVMIFLLILLNVPVIIHPQSPNRPYIKHLSTSSETLLQTHCNLYKAASFATFKLPTFSPSPPKATLLFYIHRIAGSSDCCICIRPAPTPSDTIRRLSCKNFANCENLVVNTQGPTASLFPHVPDSAAFAETFSSILDLRMSLSAPFGGPISLLTASESLITSRHY